MTGNKFKRNKSRKDKKFVQQRLPKLKTFLCANYENSPLFEFLPNCQKITRYRLNLKFLNSFLQHQHKLFSFFLLSSWSNVWLIEHSNFPAVWDIDYTRLIICQALISNQNWISTAHSGTHRLSYVWLLSAIAFVWSWPPQTSLLNSLCVRTLVLLHAPIKFLHVELILLLTCSFSPSTLKRSLLEITITLA